MKQRGSPGVLVGLATLAVALAGVAIADAVRRSDARSALTERLRSGVDAHIRTLRKKLGEDVIETLIGSGYAFRGRP